MRHRFIFHAPRSVATFSYNFDRMISLKYMYTERSGAIASIVLLFLLALVLTIPASFLFKQSPWILVGLLTPQVGLAIALLMKVQLRSMVDEEIDGTTYYLTDGRAYVIVGTWAIVAALLAATALALLGNAFAQCDTYNESGFVTWLCNSTYCPANATSLYRTPNFAETFLWYARGPASGVADRVLGTNSVPTTRP
jgi:hypothetical protein